MNTTLDLGKIQEEGFYDDIVKILYEETGQHVNIMVKDGIIVSSTRKERIGTVHESAKKILLGLINEALVTEEEAKKLNGVKAGCNLPIVYKGERIGVIGMTGDPHIVKPIVKVAARMVTLWINNHENLMLLNKSVDEVYSQLQNMAATIEELAASSETFAVSSKKTSKETEEAGGQVQEVAIAIKLIKDIASQSKLIGLNAAIEAARSGEAGRGFAVVAKEIQKLGSSSEDAVKEIQDILKQIENVFAIILAQVQLNEKQAEEYSTAIQELAQYVEQIERMMETLTQTNNFM